MREQVHEPHARGVAERLEELRRRLRLLVATASRRRAARNRRLARASRSCCSLQVELTSVDILTNVDVTVKRAFTTSLPAVHLADAHAGRRAADNRADSCHRDSGEKHSEENDPSRAGLCLRAQRCALRSRRGCAGRSGQAVERLRHRGRIQHGWPVRDCCGRGLSEAQSEGAGDGCHLRHGRRLRAFLPGRDRSFERITTDARYRGGEMPRREREMGRVHRRERRAVRRRQQEQHLGELPHSRRAQEDLGAGLQGRQLESGARWIPERAAEAVRRGNGLRHLRLLHRSDQRPRPRQQVGLPGHRGRQRHRDRCRGRTRRARLLRLLVLRGEQGQAQGPRDRRGQGWRRTPSIATVQANKYRPLSRPLFIYAKRESFRRPVVAGYVGYVFNNEKAIAKQSASSPSRTASSKRRGTSTGLR